MNSMAIRYNIQQPPRHNSKIFAMPQLRTWRLLGLQVKSFFCGNQVFATVRAFCTRNCNNSTPDSFSNSISISTTGTTPCILPGQSLTYMRIKISKNYKMIITGDNRLNALLQLIIGLNFPIIRRTKGYSIAY